MAKVEYNMDSLNQIVKNLKSKKFVRIGIIGPKAKASHDKESGLTNAELGAVHEFGANINHPGGTPYKILSNGQARFVSKKDAGDLPVTGPHNIKIPARSFLAQPLKEKLNFKSDEMKDIKKALFKGYFVNNDPDKFLQDLGAKAVDVVNEAFNTNGYGQWKELTSSTKRQKAKKGYSPNTLVTTGRGGLSSTIDFEVKKND